MDIDKQIEDYERKITELKAKKSELKQQSTDIDYNLKKLNDIIVDKKQKLNDSNYLNAYMSNKTTDITLISIIESVININKSLSDRLHKLENDHKFAPSNTSRVLEA
jgi:chromosome segregation ATPase